jgi:hypothetical protein
MAAHQTAVEETSASAFSAFVGLITLERLGLKVGEWLGAIMKLNRNGTRVVTFLPFAELPFDRFGTFCKGIVSG